MVATNGHQNGASNGHSSRRPLRAGIYAPTMTFFDPTTEDLDLPSIRKHSIRLAEAGLMGLVTMGSNGEAVHLSRAERTLVTKTTREALDSAGFTQIPVIVGATEQSVRGTIELCEESAAAGGDYVLLIPPSYFRGMMTDAALYDYFMGVADGSPIPIILYNYPGAVAGIDMDSDFLIKISQHPNVVGTKFTCGNTGKLTRVATTVDAVTPCMSPAAKGETGKGEYHQGSGYMAFGGMADFTAQTFISGGSGIIGGGANVIPKVCVKVWTLLEQGKLQEAFELQKLLSKGDWILTKSAIPGTKSAIQSYYGYGGYPRRPIQRLSEEKVQDVKDAMASIMKIELSL